MRVKTNNGKTYEFPELQAEKMEATLRQWKDDCVKLAHGHWDSEMEAFNFPHLIRDYCEKYLTDFEIKA